MRPDQRTGARTSAAATFSRWPEHALTRLLLLSRQLTARAKDLSIVGLEHFPNRAEDERGNTPLNLIYTLARRTTDPDGIDREAQHDWQYELKKRSIAAGLSGDFSS